MNRQIVLEKIGIFIRDLFLNKSINFEDAQDLSSQTLAIISEGLEQDKLLKAVQSLDDHAPKLTPIVYKLLGEWGNI